MYNIMVFGIEKVELTPPPSQPRARDYALSFHPYKIPRHALLITMASFSFRVHSSESTCIEPRDSSKRITLTYARNELDKFPALPRSQISGFLAAPSG